MIVCAKNLLRLVGEEVVIFEERVIIKNVWNLMALGKRVFFVDCKVCANNRKIREGGETEVVPGS